MTWNSTPPDTYSNTPQASPHTPEVVVWAPTIKTLQPFPHTSVVSLGIGNQATISTISRPGYPYLAPLFGGIRKASTALLLSGTAVHVRWTPGHSGTTSNSLADCAAKLATEGIPLADAPSPWPYSNFRSQIRGKLLREWQVWHKPRDDFPFPPATKLSAIFTLPCHVAMRLSPVELTGVGMEWGSAELMR